MTVRSRSASDTRIYGSFMSATLDHVRLSGQARRHRPYWADPDHRPARQRSAPWLSGPRVTSRCFPYLAAGTDLSVHSADDIAGIARTSTAGPARPSNR